MRSRLVAGAVVVVAGLGAAQAHAAYPGTNGRIAYAGVGNIGTINAAGGARTPLISRPGFLMASPAWSPDGQRIAFSSNHEGNSEIYVAAAAGTGVTRLTTSANDDFEPTWSPDGTRIAFESDDAGTGRAQILVMNANGSGVVNLSAGLSDDRTPAWSPDGTRIAFARGPQDGDHNIVVVPSAGALNATPLTSSAIDEDNPDWSPDGSRIVFERNDTLVVMAATGGSEVPLPIGTARRPSWSPDGTRIVYDSGFELFSVNPNGTGVTPLTTGGTGTLYSQSPSWQPIPIPPPGGGGGGGTPPPVDADGDGFSPPADCNDANPAINPGAKDKRGDKLDQDCKGGPAPLVRIKRALNVISATYPAGYMTFQTMSVGNARKGDKVTLSCKGGGCTFKAKTIKVKKNARKLSLVSRVKGMQLRKGATFQLRITRAGQIGQVRTWVVRAPKIPKITDQCLRPGAKKPSRCPR